MIGEELENSGTNQSENMVMDLEERQEETEEFENAHLNKGNDLEFARNKEIETITTANALPEEREGNQNETCKNKISERHINEKGILKRINETDITNT